MLSWTVCHYEKHFYCRLFEVVKIFPCPCVLASSSVRPLRDLHIHRGITQASAGARTRFLPLPPPRARLLRAEHSATVSGIERIRLTAPSDLSSPAPSRPRQQRSRSYACALALSIRPKAERQGRTREGGRARGVSTSSFCK